MLRVAIAGTFAASLEQPLRCHLAMPCDIVTSDEAGIVRYLSDADILVTMRLTAEMGHAATRLKLVQVPGAGLDAIERAALPADALLANVFGHEIGVAEYAMGAMLALTRAFSRLDAALRRGDWQSQWAVGAPVPPVWPELAGRTIGILGYGRIGQAIARRARALDMRICAIRRDVGRSADDDLLGGPEILEEVLRRADYVVIAMPAAAETKGAIDRRALALMKSTAFLINVARAEIIDEAALYDPAVTSGEQADETGIVIAGKDKNGHGYVLADLSGRYPPTEWARVAITAYRTHGADRIVAPMATTTIGLRLETPGQGRMIPSASCSRPGCD
jgi:lactate dehydrogenase-like 2-hydroxyacid dehydrogenase